MTDTKARTRLEAEVLARGKTIGWLAEHVPFSYNHTWQVVSGRKVGSLDFYQRAAAALRAPLASVLPEEEAVA